MHIHLQIIKSQDLIELSEQCVSFGEHIRDIFKSLEKNELSDFDTFEFCEYLEITKAIFLEKGEELFDYNNEEQAKVVAQGIVAVERIIAVLMGKLKDEITQKNL